MKKRTLKGTREANTMLALVIVTTAQLTGPYAHADIILDGTETINASVTHGNVTLGLFDLEADLAMPGTLNVTSSGVLNTTSLFVGDQAEGLLDVDGGTVNVVEVTELGFAGKGTINVTNSGTLNTNSIEVGFAGEGLLNVNGGFVNVTEDAYFWSSETNASAAVTNGTLAIGGDLFLGEGLATGLKTLNINSNGTVLVSGNLTRGATGSVINLNTGGTLQIGNGVTTGPLLEGMGNLKNDGTLIFNRSNDSSYSGVLSGSGALVQQGTGTLTISGANTYTGATYIRNSGTLNANVANALPTANGRSAVIMDDTGPGGSTLSLAASQLIASLTGAADSLVSLLTGTSLTVGASTGTATFTGVISGDGGLTKDGASTQTLTGDNYYTGGTTLNGGTLALSGLSGALTATNAVNINGGTLLLSGSAANRIKDTAPISLGAAGSTLQLSGAVTETLGAMTLSGGAGARVIDFGATSGVLTFTSLSAASSLPLQIWNWSGTFRAGGGTDQLIISNGSFGGSLTASDISFFSDSGVNRISGATVFTSGGELVPVPEASTLLGVLGLMAPLAWRERRHWMRCREARG
jgi:fibronectin-binding autotransporter adhesin